MKFYEPGEIDRKALTSLGRQTFNIEPFDWQIATAEAVLQGRDVVLDVGTGSGKTIAFTLALVLHKEDIAIVISPLSSLMIEQMETAPISTIAVCRETFERTSKDQVFKDINAGKFRRVIVSPEIAISPDFGQSVLSKKTIQQQLRCFIVDEAHCVAEWGNSFRPDYSKIGALRGRIGKSVPFLIASATLPSHILDVVKKELNIDARPVIISLTNERKNIALSTREIQHEDSSKADLRFTIPRNTRGPQDIPITLIYANDRHICEDIYDQLMLFSPPGLPKDTIAFYHAMIGGKRKRYLEEGLRKGVVRIMICTDAVGMGCDLRNIDRVVLWDLPRSFCSLVQRAGRAARDLSRFGEAILMVRKGTRKEGVSALDVSNLQSQILTDDKGLDLREDFDEVNRMEIENVVETSGHEIRHLNDGGRRVERIEEGGSEEAVEGSNGPKSRKKPQSQIERLEVAYLTLYANTSSCLRKVWDKYFENDKKTRLVYKKNTLYRDVSGVRCCSNCDPDKFPMEDIVLQKKPGLKRGRRTNVPEDFRTYAKQRLVAWREALLDRLYPDSHLVTAQSVMGDDIIEALASQGKRVSSAVDLLTRVRWINGTEQVQALSPSPNDDGRALFIELQDIYNEYDKTHPAGEETEEELDEEDDKGLDGAGEGGEKNKPTTTGRQIRVLSSGSKIRFVISGPSSSSAPQ